MPSRDETLLAVLEEDVPLPTSEVADELGVSHAGAWRRLSTLAEAGLVERTSQRGADPDLWALTDAGHARLDE